MSPTSPATTTSAVSVAGKAPAPEVAPAAPLQAILVIHGIGQQQPFQALGIQEAYGPYLRMMADGHMMFQPQKGEAAEGKTPTPAMFVYSDDLQASQAIDTAAPDQSDGAVRTPDGQEYV